MEAFKVVGVRADGTRWSLATLDEEGATEYPTGIIPAYPVPGAGPLWAFLTMEATEGWFDNLWFCYQPHVALELWRCDIAKSRSIAAWKLNDGFRRVLLKHEKEQIVLADRITLLDCIGRIEKDKVYE